MTYIHELPGWPHFKWSSHTLSAILPAVRCREGKIIGRMQSLGFELQEEANLKTLTHDVVKSAAIEGGQLDPREVKSSLARRLGLDTGGLVTPGRDVEGIVEMMLDAVQNHPKPLTADRLFDWHAALFPAGRSGIHRITTGAWRPKEAGTMKVVSGPLGRETVHFQAPDAERVPKEMENLLAWFNQPPGKAPDIDPVLKAGIAHLWFVTIHPFEDGNGRIARAIADMLLARADNSGYRFYSMSSQIESERREYYKQLESQQRGDLDITPWLTWFLNCLDRAFDRAEKTIESVFYKSRIWDYANRQALNERQRLIIGRMLDDFKGYMNTSKYSKIASCSPDTALRDIRELLNRGVLIQNPAGGRSTSYRLAENI
jgi:Fic family protein